MLVLASNPVPPAFDRSIRELVTAHGGIWIPSPEEREERIALIERHIGDATVFFGGRLSDEQFARARALRWIHVPWAGVNTIMGTRGIHDREIIITNSSGVMADSVADHVLGATVMLFRDLATQVKAQQRHEWIGYETESPKRKLLRGRTMGVLGFGAIGRAVATRARAFGMRILATRRDVTKDAPEVDALYSSEQTAEMLGQCDVVVVALPLTPETRGSIGRELFQSMRREAFFVNIARGAVVVESELVDALEDGTIRGAALDVFVKEPLAVDSPFWDMPNVIVTPHSSGAFQGYREAAAELFLENLRRFLDGEELINVVTDGY